MWGFYLPATRTCEQQAFQLESRKNMIDLCRLPWRSNPTLTLTGFGSKMLENILVMTRKRAIRLPFRKCHVYSGWQEFYLTLQFSRTLSNRRLTETPFLATREVQNVFFDKPIKDFLLAICDRSCRFLSFRENARPLHVRASGDISQTNRQTE